MFLSIEGWLTIKIKSRQEKRAKKNLEKQGFSCFFPNISTQETGKKIISTKLMFPGYGFVNLKSNQSLISINSTFGVSEVIHFGSYYPVLQSNVINSFKKIERLCAKDPIINIKAGEEIIFQKGPLKELKGIVSSVDRKRIKVLYILLNQSHQTEIDISEVKLN